MRRPEYLHPDAALLGAPTPAPRVFDPTGLGDLPDPVRRWLLAATEPGAPLLRTARLKMHGEIKVTKWVPFHADQVLSPDGFVWSAHAGRFLMRISGFDRFSDGGDDQFDRAMVVHLSGPLPDPCTRGGSPGSATCPMSAAVGTAQVTWHRSPRLAGRGLRSGSRHGMISRNGPSTADGADRRAARIPDTAERSRKEPHHG